MDDQVRSSDAELSQFGPPPLIRHALELVRAEEAETVADQIRFCEIPAPTFQEQRRAAVLAEDFRDAHLKGVRVDQAGNVHGSYGEGPRYVVVTAHMDTVFPADTPISVRRDGPVLAAPGIGDDARGLATLVRMARILDRAAVATRLPILFAGTVAEEGYGNSQGVQHLCDRELTGQIAAFLSIDGAGMAIANTAVGSYRYRVTITGPGGHSYRSYGSPNPNIAVGRAIAKAAAVRLPEQPRGTINFGRIEGGTGPNRLPHRAWLEVEVRSSDTQLLELARDEVIAAIHAGVDEEQAAATRPGRLDVSADLLGHRPAGHTPEDSPIVEAARSATAAVGADARFEAHSTDANYPICLGIPALALGVGAVQENTHSLREIFDTTDAWQGVARALLTVLGVAEPLTFSPPPAGRADSSVI